MKLLGTMLIGLLAVSALSPGFAQSQATGTGTKDFVLIPLQHINPELVAQLLGGVVIYDLSGPLGGSGGYRGGYGGYGGYGGGYVPYAGSGYAGALGSRAYGGRYNPRAGASVPGYAYGGAGGPSW
jgi:hypothetical protein